jgi:hypothetical protein
MPKYYILNMPQDATLVGAKQLSTKELAIMNSSFIHVAYKNFRCVSLNTLMFL